MKTKIKPLKERYAPLRKLAKIWLNDFLQNKETYINTLIPLIISEDFANFTKSEVELLNEIRTNFKKSEWKNFKSLFLSTINSIQKETHNADVLTRAENFLLNDNFLAFETIPAPFNNFISLSACLLNLIIYIYHSSSGSYMEHSSNGSLPASIMLSAIPGIEFRYNVS